MPRHVRAGPAIHSILPGFLVGLALVQSAVPPRSAMVEHGTTPPAHVLMMANLASVYVAVDEGAQHLQARTQLNTRRDHWTIERAFPALVRVPVVGREYAVDPELVIALHPDAVVAWSAEAGPLRQLGVPGVVESRLSGKTPTRVRVAIWNDLAHLAGRTQRAEQLLSRSALKRAAVHDFMKQSLLDLHRPKALIVMGTYQGRYWLGNVRHYHNENIESAGACLAIDQKNGPFVTGASGSVANLEQVLLLDPDVVFVESWEIGDTLGPVDMYRGTEWQAVRAVRERHVYKMPDLPTFLTPLEDPIRQQWLAEVLHPNVAQQQTRRETRETFRAVLGYAIGEDEIDRILRLQENRMSAAYERFARSCEETTCN